MNDWKTSAACRNADPDLFFAEGRGSRGQVQEAQAVCHGCPVRRECGEDALTRGEYWGVWGGMSQQQLRARRNRYGHSSQARTVTPKPKRKKQEPAKCGTRSGYQKHLREKTEPCPPCRQANTDADNRLRRTGTTKATA